MCGSFRFSFFLSLQLNLISILYVCVCVWVGNWAKINANNFIFASRQRMHLGASKHLRCDGAHTRRTSIVSCMRIPRKCGRMNSHVEQPMACNPIKVRTNETVSFSARTPENICSIVCEIDAVLLLFAQFDTHFFPSVCFDRLSMFDSFLFGTTSALESCGLLSFA